LALSTSIHDVLRNARVAARLAVAGGVNRRSNKTLSFQ
jgi:hypothetical protein